MIDGEPARDVAESLGAQTGYIYVMKYRVLRRLRELAAGLVDDVDETL